MLPILVLGGLLAQPAPDVRAAALARHEFSEPHMGTTFRIVLYASSEEEAARINALAKRARGATTRLILYLEQAKAPGQR